jgi:hypothetical protein
VCDASERDAVALAARARAVRVPVVVGATWAFNGAFFVDAGAAHAYIRVRAGEVGGVGGGESAAAEAVVTRAYAPLVGALSGAAFRALEAKHTTPGAFAWLAALAAGGAGRLPPAEGGNGAARAAAIAAECEILAPGDAARADALAIGEVAGSAASEFSPVAAVVGGVLANEAIKIVTGKDEPLSNLFVFDGMGGSGGRVFDVKG